MLGKVVLGVAAVLGFCVVVWLGLGWYFSRHATRVDAFVTVVNLAGDCKVRIPPAAEEHRMLCRELPEYLQKEADLPLGSAFIVFVYGKVPLEDTDRVIEPLQQKGYRFLGVLQAKVTEPGAFPPKEF
jgi:hypothetical protein